MRRLCADCAQVVRRLCGRVGVEPSICGPWRLRGGYLLLRRVALRLQLCLMGRLLGEK